MIEVGYIEFVSLKDEYDFDQRDKDVQQISEVTHTFEVHKEHSVYAEEGRCEFNIEMRQGQFEYAFLYNKWSNPIVMLPGANAIITSLQCHVMGTENLFLSRLDKYDIERISRSNCHKQCNWRDLHDKGQGILIHLSDLGLTREIGYGPKKRIRLKISVNSTITPEEKAAVVTFKPTLLGEVPEADIETTLVLIRNNQLLRGDIRDMRFTYLNES